MASEAIPVPLAGNNNHEIITPKAEGGTGENRPIFVPRTDWPLSVPAAGGQREAPRPPPESPRAHRLAGRLTAGHSNPVTWAAGDAFAAGPASDGVTASVRPDGSLTRFRCYSRSLPVPLPASGLAAEGLGRRGPLWPLRVAGARSAPSRVGGGLRGRRERTHGDGDSGCDPARPGTRRGGRPASGGLWTPRGPRRSRRVAAGPRPSFAPSPWCRVRQEPLRFVSRVFLSRPSTISPSRLRTPSLVIRRGNRGQGGGGSVATPRREDDVVPALPTRAAPRASSGWGGPRGGMSPLAATSGAGTVSARLEVTRRAGASGRRTQVFEPALPLEC